MASMLSLNDDCLYEIVSCLDDPRSFHSLALTCKRFLQVTKSTRSDDLHSNILRAKAQYFMKCFEWCKCCIVDINIAKGCYKLYNLLLVAPRLAAAKGILTYAKVVDQWQRNGPVAAKMFTWIRKKDSYEKPESRHVTLHLPNCNKSIWISCLYSAEIHVKCGDLDVRSARCPENSLKHFLHCEEEKVNSVVEPLKPAIELLQKELGDTIPLITGQFFSWLCFVFPDKAIDLPEESRLSFTDTVRNTKPSPDAVQLAMDLCRQEDEAKYQSLVSEWKNDDEEESEYSKTMLETIDLLVRRSETKVLEWLLDCNRWYFAVMTSGINAEMFDRVVPNAQ